MINFVKLARSIEHALDILVTSERPEADMNIASTFVGTLRNILMVLTVKNLGGNTFEIITQKIYSLKCYYRTYKLYDNTIRYT